MLEKYKYTGKHRASNESLTPAELFVRDAKSMAYSAIQEDTDSPDTTPDLERPLSTSERIDLAPSPQIAFQEVLSDANGDPVQTIRNVDLALKHFDADNFTEEEKMLLSDIVVESSEEIINKATKKVPTSDFADPIVLGSAVDLLHELEGTPEDTEPILDGIVTIVENISDPDKNADHTAKLTPDEATAFVETVKEFEHLPAHHNQRLLELLDDHLRRITEANITYHELKRDHIKKKPQSLEDIRRSVDRYHDRKLLRRHRVMAHAAATLDSTAAQPVIREKDVA